MLGQPGKWTKVPLSGETKCGDGDPFAYWIRHPEKNLAENKLLIFFQGGGYAHELNADQYINSKHTNIIKRCALNNKGGIFNFNEPRNPFKGYHVVFIPYCTGDFHWGNNTASYNTVTFHHKGFFNATAALTQVYGEIKNPDIVFITGSSAGGMGSILHAPGIIENYPSSRVSHLSDCAVGVVADPAMWVELYQNYRMFQDPLMLHVLGQSKHAVSDLYISIASRFSDTFFSQFSFTHDTVQAQMFTGSGGNMQSFSEHLGTSLLRIRAQTPNFRFFTVPGTEHCILSSDHAYELGVNAVRSAQVDKVNLMAWITQIAEDPVSARDVYVN